MKKIRIVLLGPVVLLLVFYLAACGNNDSNDRSAADTLILASFSQDNSNRAEVDRFNQTHTDVQIEIQDYYSRDYQETVRNVDRFLTEITAGNVPDIIDLGDVDLPYRQMIQKEYFEDLGPYIENDPDIGWDSLLEAPVKAAEMEGKFYFAFDSVKILTAVGSSEVVGDRISWTTADLWEAFGAMPDGSSVLEFYFDKSEVLSYLLAERLEQYVDWETGQCSFDCPDFRSTLEFAGSFPTESVSGMDIERVNAERVQRLMEGRQMLMTTVLTRPDQIQDYDIEWGGRAAFVGYPVEDSGVGSSFLLADSKLVMTSGCRNKEAAWEFIRTKFLPKYSDVNSAARAYREISGIPVNRADYDKVREVSMREDVYDNWYNLAEEKMHAVTEEEMQRFEDLLYHIEQTGIQDKSLLQIAKEASAPYFTGDKTLDETVALLQNRVSLYVNENM